MYNTLQYIIPFIILRSCSPSAPPCAAMRRAWDLRHGEDAQLVDGGRRNHALRGDVGQQGPGTSSAAQRGKDPVQPRMLAMRKLSMYVWENHGKNQLGGGNVPSIWSKWDMIDHIF